MSTETCQLNHNFNHLVFSITMIVLMSISYTPQVIKLIRMKSNQGISIYYLTLRLLGSIGTLNSVIILQKHVLFCCPSKTIGLCLENLLGVLFSMIQFFFSLLIVFLFYWYHPRPTNGLQSKRRLFTLDSNHINGLIATGYLLLSIFLTGIILSLDERSHVLVATWVSFNGILSMLTAVLKFIPQIVVTYLNKSTGSFSIATLVLQTPGTFAVAFMLAKKDGTTWAAWSSYLVSGVLGCVLLLECAVVRYHRHYLSKSKTKPEVRQAFV